MTDLDVKIIVDKKDVEQLGQMPRQTNQALVRTVTRLLDVIEDTTLIRQYTQTSRPTKPTGSNYIRTFRMQRNSEKQITRERLPVAGFWRAKVEYASMVIGLSAQQAPIHIGRWPMLEAAINRTNRLASPIFNEEVSKERL
jgi:hypothetical protein